MFPQAIDVSIEWKRCLNTKVLWLEDDRESGGVEEHLVVRLADD